MFLYSFFPFSYIQGCFCTNLMSLHFNSYPNTFKNKKCDSLGLILKNKLITDNSTSNYIKYYDVVNGTHWPFTSKT